MHSREGDQKEEAWGRGRRQDEETAVEVKDEEPTCWRHGRGTKLLKSRTRKQTVEVKNKFYDARLQALVPVTQH